MVTATDTSNTMVNDSPVTKEVMINVTDVDEAPTVTVTDDITAYNYIENDTAAVATFMKPERDEGVLTDWVLSGPDADRV